MNNWRLLRIAFVILALLIPGTIMSDIWLDINYELAANVCLGIAALLVSIFTLLYGFRSKWRTNRIGPIYLIKCVAMSAFLNQAAVAVWIDEDYPFRQMIRFVIYAATALVYVPMLVALWLAQQNDRRRAAEMDDEIDGPTVRFGDIV
ncbi:DUF4231 domain-containing protein [Mycobacterium hackensackense]|uniref:DUF4231 domain-containing protein n=1 Tax=Mycobacterium hackensackense TaxID=228909 RepID=UPI002265E18C|nr:DUF4231 domain-containing protein [Mycobacterium hackensackense]